MTVVIRPCPSTLIESVTRRACPRRRAPSTLRQPAHAQTKRDPLSFLMVTRHRAGCPRLRRRGAVEMRTPSTESRLEAPRRRRVPGVENASGSDSRSWVQRSANAVEAYSEPLPCCAVERNPATTRVRTSDPSANAQRTMSLRLQPKVMLTLAALAALTRSQVFGQSTTWLGCFGSS